MNRTFGTENFIHPTAGVINRTGADKILAGGVTISRGETWWYEGTYSGSPWGPYRGTTTADFDGMGPSGPDRANYSEIFFITTQDNAFGGRSLGQTTSYDLVFDPADKIIIVGFAALNYDNFQSWQSGGYAGYPNRFSDADVRWPDSASIGGQRLLLWL